MAVKGGKRAGAGRKKGSKNKATKKRAEVAAKALDSGITPLDFMLSIMREPQPVQGDDEDPALFVARYIGWRDRAFDAAKAAAPYVHPKLANIEHVGEGGGPIQASLEVRFIPSPKSK